MPLKTKFTEGEKVLCFHGPLLYEAKCMRSEQKDKTIRYFIHYSGWNKNWDEWVPESRVLKFNEQGLQKQRELIKAHQKSKQNRVPKNKKNEKDKDKEKHERERERASTPAAEERIERGKRKKEEKHEKDKDKEKDKGSEQKSVADAEPPKKKRAKPDPTVEPVKAIEKAEKDSKDTKDTKIAKVVSKEEAFVSKLEVKVRIPEELKPWLADDWDLITRQKMLVSLPAKMSVESILNEYVKAKTAKGNYPHKDAIMEVTAGIREYFNSMLGTQLLYKFERPQYGELLSSRPDTPMCELYGAAHLLRLFVKIGGMLAYTSLDDKSIQVLLTHFHDFVNYMKRNAGTYFSVADYIVAPPDYHRKAI